MLKNTTENHEDYKALLDGKAKVDVIVNQVNERVRKVENVTKLIAVNRTINYTHFVCVSPDSSFHLAFNNLFNQKFDILSDQNRRLILEGELKMNGKSSYCFLFNDVFLICTLKGETREARRTIALNFAITSNLEDTDGSLL